MSKPDLNRFKLSNPFTDTESSSTSAAEDDATKADAGSNQQRGDADLGKTGTRKKEAPAMVQRQRAGTWNAAMPSASSKYSADGRQVQYNDTARSYNLKVGANNNDDADHASSDDDSHFIADGYDETTPATQPRLEPRGASPKSQAASLDVNAAISTWTPRSPTNLTTLNHTFTTTTTTTTTAPATTTTTSTVTTTTTTNTLSVADATQKTAAGTAARKGAPPKIPTLQLPGLSKPDPTETQKSSRTSMGQKNSSDLLTVDASKLRKMGEGKTSMRLPEFENIGTLYLAKSESLAAQLVIAASKWFQSGLTQSTASTMLRAGVSMKESTSNDQDKEDQNVIEKLLTPFISHHIKKSKIPEILEKIKTTYENEVAKKAVEMHRKYADENKSKNTKVANFNDLPEVKHLMDPLIKPLIDSLLGKGEGKGKGKVKEESWMYTVYPAPVLNLLVNLAAWTKKWHEANSSLESEVFDKAQMNALKSIVATRSFMIEFTLALKKATTEEAGRQRSADGDEGGWDDYYTPLLNYMNSTVTKTMETLIRNVIKATENEKSLIQSFADIAESRVLRSDDKAAGELAESVARVKARKPKKFTTRLRDAISPRGSHETATAPRKPLKRAGTLNARAPKSEDDTMEATSVTQASDGATTIFTEDMNRELKLVKTREKFMRSYFDKVKLGAVETKFDKASFPEWTEILTSYIKQISKGSREVYQAFREAPDQQFLNYLNEFIGNNRFHNQEPSGQLRELKAFIENRLSTTSAQSVTNKQ